MKIKQWYLLAFIWLSSIFLFFDQEACAQKTDTTTATDGLVSVTLRVIGKGSIDHFRDHRNGYFAMVTVTNNQDTAIHFYIMNCSWYYENFFSSNHSYFGSGGCDTTLPSV